MYVRVCADLYGAYRFRYLLNSQMLSETDYFALVAYAAYRQLGNEGGGRFMQLSVSFAALAPFLPAEGVNCRWAAAPQVEVRSQTTQQLLPIS